MNRLFKPSYKLLIILASVLLLTPGFYRNQWLAVGRMWFYDWRKLQEIMVISRIIESRETGVLSDGGLMGFGCTTIVDCDWESFSLEQTYTKYHENGKFQSFSPYTSHPGVQGILFSLFEQTTFFSPSLNLRLFHVVVSLLSALVLGLLVYWLSMELGWITGFLTLFFIALSEWMTLFSGNIFWNIWSFYLPLVVSSFYLRTTSKSDTYNWAGFGAVLALLMLVKCLFTGFEYITTALLMPLTPYVYYAIRDSWNLTNFLKRTVHASISLLTGAVMGLITLTLQISKVKGGILEAITIIVDALGKRSLGDPTQYLSEAESLNARFLPVLLQYIQGRAILVRQIIPNLDGVEEISYLALFIMFLGSTLLLLIVMRSDFSPSRRISSSALIITTWASVLAPLSWFIIFKAHSYVHTQMNFIVWQMPFTLYGFALCGYTVNITAGWIMKIFART